MASTALTACRTTVGTGQLVRKVLFLCRPPDTIPFRPLSTAPYSDTFKTAESSDVGKAGTVKIPDKVHSQPRGGGGRGSHDIWRDDDGLHARIDMPGLEMEHVKLTNDGVTVIIRGKGPEKSGELNGSDVAVGMKYLVALSPAFKLSQIRTEMKSGVLNIVVPAAEVGDSRVLLMEREYDD